MQFLENNHTPKMQGKILSTNVLLHYITCRGNRTEDPITKTCVVPPSMPHMQHPYYMLQISSCDIVNYIYISLWLILLHCK